jgi:hydroxymethylbilane synthase
VGALAEVVEGEDGLELSLRAFVGTLDGSFDLRRSVVGGADDAEALGRRLADLLLEDGGDLLPGAEHRPPAAPPAPSGDGAASRVPEAPPPDPPGATGADPVAAPDSSTDRIPEHDSTERAL